MNSYYYACLHNHLNFFRVLISVNNNEHSYLVVHVSLTVVKLDEVSIAAAIPNNT